MIFCVTKLSSIRRARKISSSFRRNVLSLSAKLLRASCCVIVLAPCRTRAAVRFLIVARTMPNKLRSLCRANGIDEIARQLIVGNGLAILDINLAEDLAVAIENHAGGFHLFQPAQLAASFLAPQTG